MSSQRQLFRDTDVKPGPVPRDVLSYWRSKGLKPSFSYKDVWGEEHNFAFAAAKIMRVDVLNALHSELGKAIEQGLPFAQFKQEVAPRLQKLGWWAPHEVEDPKTGKVAKVDPPARLKLIYDTNMRTARAVGQWERIQRTKEHRPYLLYLTGPAIHHREQHLAWHGLLLPVDDPFWQAHFPPNGWQCHCYVRTVSQSEHDSMETVQRPVVDDQGKTTGEQESVPVRRTAPPAKLVPWHNSRTGETHLVPEGVDPGFEHPPGEGRRIALKDIPEVTTPPAPPPPDPLHDPQHWLDQEYRAKYGEEAGKAVAWGRAMEERGMGTAIDEGKRQLVELADKHGVTISDYFGAVFERAHALMRDDIHTIGQLVAAMRDKGPDKWKSEIIELRALSALIAHRASVQAKERTIAAPKFASQTPKEVRTRAVATLGRVRRFFSELSDAKVDHADKGNGYAVKWRASRAQFDPGARLVYTRWRGTGQAADMGESTIVHEMGHGIEHMNAWALHAASQFLERRTAGETARHLGNGYKAHEVTKEDKFFNAYVGKEYVSMGGRYATEVTSMALEFMHRQAAQLMQDDEDCFYFGLGQLAGAAKP
jgi:hypothetical protein